MKTRQTNEEIYSSQEKSTHQYKTITILWNTKMALALKLQKIEDFQPKKLLKEERG